MPLQAIEALDPNHQCLEYWNQKRGVKIETVNGTSARKGEYPFGSSCYREGKRAKLFGFDLTKQDPEDSSTGRGDHAVGEGTKTTLQGLFRKANREELETMYRVLCRGYTSAEWEEAFTTLTEEIQRECK